MTVGSRSSIGTSLYLGTVGLTEETSWSGGDSPTFPRKPPRKKNVYKNIFRTVLVPIREGKHAGQLREKLVKFRVLESLGDPWVPITRDPRSYGEHSYSKSSKVWHSFAVAPRYWYGPHTKGSDWIWTTLGGDWPLDPLFDSNDYNRLLGKLWARVKGSDFNAAIALGESHQTLALVADSAIRIAKCYFHIRKGDASGGLRSLIEGTSRAPLMKRFNPSMTKTLYPNLSADVNSQARLLLEIQYGWRPLVNDVYSAAEMLAQELSVPRSNIVRVGIKRGGPTKRVVSGNFWDSNFNSFGPGGCEFPGVYKHEWRIKAIFSESDLPSLPARLGLTNPEQVLYELVPFSFLADWIIPIGPALEARAAATNLSGQFVITNFLLRSESGATGFWGNLAETLGSCPGSFARMSISREVTDHLTAMLPKVKPLGKAFSMEHCINAVALAASAATLPLGVLKSSIMRIDSHHSGLFK